MTKVDKPWGHELIWASTERYVGKILFVRAGEALSLQYHRVKDETIMVLSGRMMFTHFSDGEEPATRELAANEPFHDHAGPAPPDGRDRGLPRSSRCRLRSSTMSSGSKIVTAVSSNAAAPA